MFKTKTLIFLIILINIIHRIESIQNRHWIVSCSSCSTHLKFCNSCFGIRQCKSCLTSIRPECFSCIDDVFDKNELEIIDHNEYFLCDQFEPIHEQICHLYCRGNFYQTGSCKWFQDKPVCLCTKNPQCSNQNAIVHYATDHKDEINSIIVLKNGNLVTSSVDRTINIWNKSDYSMIKKLEYSSPIWSLAELNNEILASGTTKGEIILWNMTDWTVKEIKNIYSGIEAMILLENGLLVCGCRDNTVKILNITNFNLVGSLNNHTGNINALVVLKNGDFASGSVDKTIVIWNKTDLSLIKKLHGHIGSVESLTVLKNGDLVSGDKKNKIIVWDLIDFSIKKIITSINGIHSLFAFSNGLLASGLTDGTVQIWDTTNWRYKQTYKNVTSKSYVFSLLPNGDLANGYLNGILIVWNKCLFD